jgi:hypothetical protein
MYDEQSGSWLSQHYPAFDPDLLPKTSAVYDGDWFLKTS